MSLVTNSNVRTFSVAAEDPFLFFISIISLVSNHRFIHDRVVAVSYTHLDVYKRQGIVRSVLKRHIGLWPKEMWLRGNFIVDSLVKEK